MWGSGVKVATLDLKSSAHMSVPVRIRPPLPGGTTSSNLVESKVRLASRMKTEGAWFG